VIRWPWNKGGESSGGAEARVAAEQGLAVTRAQWPEVKRVSGSLRALRERNHFAQQLERVFDGRSKP